MVHRASVQPTISDIIIGDFSPKCKPFPALPRPDPGGHRGRKSSFNGPVNARFALYFPRWAVPARPARPCGSARLGFPGRESAPTNPRGPAPAFFTPVPRPKRIR